MVDTGAGRDGQRHPTPPAGARAIVLVTRFALKRWLNRWLAGGWRVAQPRGPGVADAPRRAVPGKRNTRLSALLILGSVLFGFQVIAQTSSVAIRLAQDDEMLVGSAASDCLRWADDHRAVETQSSTIEKRDDYLRECFERDLEWRGMRPDANRVARALQRYDAHGRGAFRETPSFLSLWSESSPWPATARATGVFLALSALVLFGIAMTAVGSAEARQLEDELSWLYQMPVKASALLGAKAIVLCFVQPAAWIVGAPMFFALARMHGRGAAAYAFGAWAALQIGAFAGAVELVTPLALGRVLGRSMVRSVQGVFAIAGAVCIGGVVLAAQQLPPALEHAPSWFAFLPGACLLSVMDPTGSGSAAIVGVAWVVFPPTAAALVGGRLVARGLVVSPGEISSRRGAGSVDAATSPGGSEPARRSRGIAGKDMRWITRDRRAFATVFLLPGLMVLLQLVLRSGFATDLTSNVRRATAIGFGLASYGFLFSATSVVTSEGGALWLLYSFPRPLHRMLLDKVTLWASVGLGYLALLCAVGMFRARSLGEVPLDLAVAAGGVVIFAFIAAGLGALQADPFASARRPVGVGTAYLYMGFAGIFGYALAGESLYAKAVSLAFFSLLALALWQKVRNRIPYLLDPTARPPASLDLSDAILIVVAFFLVQLLVALALLQLDLGPIERASVAFSIAGSGVVAGALWILRRARIPNLREAIGVRWTAGSRRFAAALVVAPALGIALGAAALAYARAIVHVLPANGVHEAIAKGLPTGDARWFVVTAVASAPLFEEIIFRGFMYKALRRSWPGWAAALASGAAFAACHPPVAVAPILVLGIVAAALVEWSTSIIAPVLLHTTYNAVVLSGLWERLL
jgi:membrane protease YdiL (CAAX protease family)